MAASETLLQQLLSYTDFTLDGGLFCWYIWKWFLRAMVVAQAAENYEDEWGLTWCLKWGIYKSIPKLNSHSQNLEPAQSLKTFLHEIYLKWFSSSVQK